MACESPENFFHKIKVGLQYIFFKLECMSCLTCSAVTCIVMHVFTCLGIGCLKFYFPLLGSVLRASEILQILEGGGGYSDQETRK